MACKSQIPTSRRRYISGSLRIVDCDEFLRSSVWIGIELISIVISGKYEFGHTNELVGVFLPSRSGTVTESEDTTWNVRKSFENNRKNSYMEHLVS
jgi:hypothetical protein